MAKRVVSRLKVRPKYFFREWRKFRNLTQPRLAERVNMATSSISQLENGKQGFTDDTLSLLAEALNCSPGALLTINPLEKDNPWTIWEAIPKDQRAQALKVLASFASTPATGTDG